MLGSYFEVSTFSLKLLHKTCCLYIDSEQKQCQGANASILLKLNPVKIQFSTFIKPILLSQQAFLLKRKEREKLNLLTKYLHFKSLHFLKYPFQRRTIKLFNFNSLSLSFPPFLEPTIFLPLLFKYWNYRSTALYIPG